MFRKNCNIFLFMEIIGYKIQAVGEWGGGGGGQNHIFPKA